MNNINVKSLQRQPLSLKSSGYPQLTDNDFQIPSLRSQLEVDMSWNCRLRHISRCTTQDSPAPEKIILH